jgi:hypothetical protein
MLSAEAAKVLLVNAVNDVLCGVVGMVGAAALLSLWHPAAAATIVAAAATRQIAFKLLMDSLYSAPMGEPGRGVFKYGKVVSKSAALTGAPSVNGTLPTGAFAGMHKPRLVGAWLVPMGNG